MTTDVVFDFGAVLFSWRPDLLVAEQFPSQAATPQAATPVSGLRLLFRAIAAMVAGWFKKDDKA